MTGQSIQPDHTVPTLWYLLNRVACGRKGRQPTGNKSRPDSTSFRTSPTKHQGPSKGSTKLYNKSSTTGLGIRHGQQHWQQYRDDRTFELLQHTQQHTEQLQLEEAQQQNREESYLQYAEWIRQGEAKKLKGLFRSLKANELSWQRPYRDVPMADRVGHRMNAWHALWKPTKDNQVMTRLPLQEVAKQQAAQLPPPTFEQLGKTLKKLPDKAWGRMQ